MLGTHLIRRLPSQTLDMHDMSAEDLDVWRSFSAHIAPFVHSTNWIVAHNKDNVKAPVDNLDVFLEVVPTLPNLVKLHIPAEGLWVEIVSVLPLAMRERIEKLVLRSTAHGKGARRGTSRDAAVIVRGFPRLKSLNIRQFGDEDEDGSPDLIAAIQSLPRLTSFSTSACGGYYHPNLSNKWQGPIAVYIATSTYIPASVGRNLLLNLGATLKFVYVAFYFDSTPIDPLPRLPFLDIGRFYLVPADSPFLSSFLFNLHLRDLTVRFDVDHPDGQVDCVTVAPFLRAPARTLRYFSIECDYDVRRTRPLVSKEEWRKVQALGEEMGVEISLYDCWAEDDGLEN